MVTRVYTYSGATQWKREGMGREESRSVLCGGADQSGRCQGPGEAHITVPTSAAAVASGFLITAVIGARP